MVLLTGTSNVTTKKYLHGGVEQVEQQAEFVRHRKHPSVYHGLWRVYQCGIRVEQYYDLDCVLQAEFKQYGYIEWHIHRTGIRR